MSKAPMELQHKIVVLLIRSVDDSWERIVVNYEIQEEDGGLIEDRLVFYMARDETVESGPHFRCCDERTVRRPA